VVADEVRNLASKTQQSTEEISTLISDLTSNVKQAVTLVDQGLTHAQSSVDVTRESNDALSAITQEVTDISDLMTQIAAAVEEQTMTCESINRNLTVIRDSAQELSEFAKDG